MSVINYFFKKRNYLTVLAAGVVLFFACKKSITHNAIADDINELQSWLKISGQKFSSGEIIEKDVNNKVSKGRLNWNNAKTFSSNGKSYFEVPFVYENRGLNLTESYTYYLVFQKAGTQITARLKVSLDKKDYNAADTTKAFVKADFFDLLDGKRDAVWIWKTMNRSFPERAHERKNESPNLVVSTNSTKQKPSVRYYCDSYDVPNREYLCWSSYTENPYDVTCGYVTTSYTTYFVSCDDEPPLDPVVGGGGFDYTNYYGGSSPNQLSNQIIIDSLTGYPCAQAILASSYLRYDSCITLVSTLISETFGFNNDVNLTYSVDKTLTLSNSTDGYAKAGRSGTTGGYWYDQDVFLNPGVLMHSTREYTLATIVHEGIHAIIDYWTDQYKKGFIDSTQLKNMFPIFWDYNRTLSNAELAQHNQMASIYVSDIKSLLTSYNPGLSDSIKTAIAWGGLQGTTAWNARSDTNDLKRLNIIARRSGADSALYSNYFLTKCP